MKRIIKGETYDTDTAVKLCELSCNEYANDFRWHDTALYQTRGGAFFLAGEGNAMSMWCKPVLGNARGPGRGIRPVAADEARDILESEIETEVIEQVFGTAPEASASMPYTLCLTPALRAKLEEASKREGSSIDVLACTAIEAHLGT